MPHVHPSRTAGSSARVTPMSDSGAGSMASSRRFAGRSVGWDPARSAAGAALALFCGLLAWPISGAAGTIEFNPHRAYYAVELIDARPGTGIAGLDGEMVAEWDQSCDGWTMAQKSVLNIYDTDGNRRAQLDSTIATWESLDGTEYRFSVRNGTNGEETEVIEGVARMPADGSEGRAKLTRPEKKTITLPAGTLFPTGHTIVVMNEMPSAPKTVSRLVFDGLTEQGLHEVNAVIGPENEGKSSMPELASHRSWPVQLAFFAPKAMASEPEHEIGLYMFDNGVGNRVTIDFGTFQVRAVLERLEYNRLPSCN